MPNQAKATLKHIITDPVSIAPLAVLRMAFGSIMLVSTVRFILKGWIDEFYIKPPFHFTFYGFDWVKPFGATGMYVLFGVMVLAAIMVTAGLFYRLAITVFFLSFTYVELLDKTTYLNHYYFISVMAFMLMLVPANRSFSVDVRLRPQLRVTQVPGWMVNIFKLQLLLVYFFAGLSKVTSDWLIDAMPLRIWLPANSHLPVIGGLLTQLWVAYAFSWSGMLFDLLVAFFLLDKRTRRPAYIALVIFHLLTAWFFKIGMFPYIMIFVTTIFFSDNTHLRFLQLLGRWFGAPSTVQPSKTYHIPAWRNSAVLCLLALHFTLQLVVPLRFMLYPGKLYWTEEGYRFSWRVMLMEKGGTAFFHVKDPATGKQAEIMNSQYLTTLQENMMATQPDMILQYAHYLADVYRHKGIKNPIVTAESYVTLNGSGSRLYIDTTVNLAAERETLFGHRKWILPFNNKK